MKKGTSSQAAKTSSSLNLPDWSSDSFFEIPRGLYQVGDLLEEDVFFSYQGSFLLYRLKDLPWRTEDESRLKDFGVETLYIRCESESAHQEFLETHLARVLNQPRIAAKEKAKILYSTSIAIIQEVYDKPMSAENIKRSMKSIRHSIDFLSRDKSHFFELMNLAKSDFTEYAHALHCSAYAITLARQMGIKAFNQISAIGIAAILHDIGKTKIPMEILKKKGAYTNEERTEMQKHPIYSAEILHSSSVVPEISERIILEHHERIDGSGYPKNLKGSEIHLHSQIVALADCFDSLTSERAFQGAKKPLEAIAHLQGPLRAFYDQAMVVEFIKMLKKDG